MIDMLVCDRQTNIGDIHGQYTTLLKLFKYGGFPPESKYLFLGNYVDFGKQSLETIWLLLALKIKYPDNVFLLRGNHECAPTNSIYGFRDECVRRFNFNLWNGFNECFECLPVAAIINDKILCVHGGLSPNLHNLDQIRNIERPVDDPYIGLIYDLLWSDLVIDIQGCVKNVRGPSIFPTFGADKVAEFLKENDLELICRSHQVVEEGYEFYADQKLVTICSAPNQRAPNGRELYNAGALMSVDENLMCSFKILHPFDYFDGSVNLGLNFRSCASTTQSGSSLGVHLFSDTTRQSEDVPPMLKRINNSNFERSYLTTAKYRSASPGVKHAERTSKSNSENRTSSTKAESSPRVNPSGSTPATSYRSNSPGFKPVERMTKSTFKSNTGTTKYRSNSPGFKVAETSKHDSGSDTGRTETCSRPGINPSKFDFDPASLYRSKSPGVKRFLGARV